MHDAHDECLVHRRRQDPVQTAAASPKRSTRSCTRHGAGSQSHLTCQRAIDRQRPNPFHDDDEAISQPAAWSFPDCILQHPSLLSSCPIKQVSTVSRRLCESGLTRPLEDPCLDCLDIFPVNVSRVSAQQFLLSCISNGVFMVRFLISRHLST